MGNETFTAFLIYDQDSQNNYVLDSRNNLHVHHGETVQLKAHKDNMTVEIPQGLFQDPQSGEEISGSYQINANDMLSVSVQPNAGTNFISFSKTMGSERGPVNESAEIIVDPDED